MIFVPSNPKTYNKGTKSSDSVPLFCMSKMGLVNEYVPTEHILDLTTLDALDVVVELE